MFPLKEIYETYLDKTKGEYGCLPVVLTSCFDEWPGDNLCQFCLLEVYFFEIYEWLIVYGKWQVFT